MALLVFAWGCGQSGDVEKETAPPRSVAARADYTPPRVINREDVIAYRNTAARELLAEGDSITIKVTVRIDAEGGVHQPEIKEDIADKRLAGAAISVVQLMKFSSPLKDGQPTTVLLTIPVHFVHQKEK